MGLTSQDARANNGRSRAYKYVSTRRESLLRFLAR